MGGKNMPCLGEMRLEPKGLLTLTVVAVFASIPSALAQAAAIIASQEVISGAFSLTRQAVQPGYWPREDRTHVLVEIGQVYVPVVNWAFGLAILAVVIAFGSSTRLAGAYGIAVTSTMIITTLLLYLASAFARARSTRVASGRIRGSSRATACRF